MAEAVQRRQAWMLELYEDALSPTRLPQTATSSLTCRVGWNLAWMRESHAPGGHWSCRSLRRRLSRVAAVEDAATQTTARHMTRRAPSC